jgi:hypothetical protein
MPAIAKKSNYCTSGNASKMKIVGRFTVIS